MPTYRILNQQETYFLTFTTVGWIDIFTYPKYKEIILDSLRHCIHQKGLVLFGYVIMSNHLHLMARSSTENPLSGIIRDFKKYTSYQIIQSLQKKDSRQEWMLQIMRKYAEKNKRNTHFQLWQQHNRPKEVYSRKVIQQKLNYTHQNPVKAGWVRRPEDYVYSSASNYVLGLGVLEEVVVV
jgi:putative transposase